MKEKEQEKQIDKLVNPLYGILFIGLLCLFVAALLSFRTFQNVRHEPYPVPRQTKNISIQGWMTVRYIASTYDIPENLLKEKLSLTSDDETNLSLDKLAKNRRINKQDLVKQVQTIVTSFHSSKHSSPPLP